MQRIFLFWLRYRLPGAMNKALNLKRILLHLHDLFCMLEISLNNNNGRSDFVLWTVNWKERMGVNFSLYVSMCMCIELKPFLNLLNDIGKTWQLPKRQKKWKRTACRWQVLPKFFSTHVSSECLIFVRYGYGLVHHMFSFFQRFKITLNCGVWWVITTGYEPYSKWN